MNPRVSVCIPTFNGAKYLRACLDSAFTQTFPDIEVIVVDDCSTDNTVALVESYRDQRLRLFRNERNQGLVGNWNECVRRAHGDFIKFLFQDDLLYPQCVARMMAVFAQHPDLGMVFSRRDFVVQDDAPQNLVAELVANYRDPHLKFEDVQEINHGDRLFSQHLEKELNVSCVAEPPSTLIRKEVFQSLGLFNPRMKQACDVEMWLRIMFYYDIGFVDEALVSFRVHAAQMSASNYATRAAQYDRFWMLEGLLSHAEIRQRYRELETWRDGFIDHNRRSLLRPKAGWRSIRSREGLAAAARDVRDLASRRAFLQEVEKFRKTPGPIHPSLEPGAHGDRTKQ